jgi:hypothetical protein
MSGFASSSHWRSFTPGLFDRTAAQRLSKSHIAKHTLLERIRGGKVKAVAGQDEQLAEVGPENWGHVRETDIFWTTGDLTFSIRGHYEWKTVRFFDVRFEPEAVRAIGPNAPKSPDAPSVPKEAEVNKGGRPRKDWWDDFWIDICRQIYEGDLKPARQADLERAMLDWVSDHGYEVGETSIKNAARKLFKAWKL